MKYIENPVRIVETIAVGGLTLLYCVLGIAILIGLTYLLGGYNTETSILSKILC